MSNATKAKRVYDAMIVDARYRLPRLQLGGNYTVSRSWGNANGENVGSGPIRTSMDTFPEYREERWNYPMGYNPGDQRHQTRIWLDYEVPIASALGSTHVGLIQRADSGSLSMSTGSSSRAHRVNPGYVTPVQNVSYYFIPRDHSAGIRSTAPTLQ